MRIQIPAKLSGIFQPRRYKVFYGGRGGGKSWAIARALLVIGANRKTRILCTRELQKSIGDSVHKLLSDQIQSLNLSSFYTVTRANIVGLNGTEFIFGGLRTNISEIKSLEGVDICWVEEAQKVSEESWRVLIPTIRKEGSEIWLSFNPDSVDDPTYKRFIIQPPDEALTVKINYNDNKWFPDTLRREMEYDKRNDYENYLHVWEGNPRTYTDAQIFKGKFTVDVFECPIGRDGAPAVPLYFGADWGFSVDPTALVRCYINDDCLYIEHEAYGVGIDIDVTPELFAKVPGAERYMITADSARPETISYMIKRGFKMRGSVKGKGSVEDGIAFLRSFKKIIIHERCVHALDEFKKYSYKIDRLTGDVLPDIVDAHNHIIDALRYAVEKLMRGRYQFGGVGPNGA
jgi:phage terminase large subunit